MTVLQEIEAHRQQRDSLRGEQEKRRVRRQRKMLKLAGKMSELYKTGGMSYTDIGKKYGYTRQRVHQLVKLFLAGNLSA